MEQAIKKAVEKAISTGWRYKEVKSDFRIDTFLLDPLFWQALGKAEGWREDDLVYLPRCQTWCWNWHRFINHLAEGKPIDDFFTALLKP